MEFHPHSRPKVTQGPIVRRVDPTKDLQEIKHLCPLTKQLIGTEIIEAQEDSDKMIGRYFQPGVSYPIWTKTYQKVKVNMRNGVVTSVVRKVLDA